MEFLMHQFRQRLLPRLPRALTTPCKSHSSCAPGHAPKPNSTDSISRPIAHIPLVSRLFQPSNLRDVGQESRTPSEMTCKSQRLMLQAGLIHPSNPGCYYYLPAIVRSMEKLVRLIDQEMQGIGGQKLDMPSLCSAELWKRSERWDLMGKELFRLRDRHGAEYCLGPTHEEAVTELLASQGTMSYRQLPCCSIRSPESSVMSQNLDLDFYVAGSLHVVKVQADTGNIGGELSHEFQLPADIGEDVLLVCDHCSFSANTETMESGWTGCPKCQQGTLVESKGIEVGHTFYLGTRYSHIFNATFNNSQNKPVVTEMGCFGLGVTRILAAAIEVMSTEEAIHWPWVLAPYQVCVIPPKRGSKVDEVPRLAEELVLTLGEALPGLRGEVVLDDRTQMTIGKRLKDAYRLGYPYVVVLGQKAVEETPRFEVICQQTGETVFLSRDGLIDLLRCVETV
ncbi:hypothetical protein UPYG_G00032080 [Umbra pygmaea]|uniref:Anticodon-binding domain-containing protein n=1 Tax=Umbra pygmaea TaxID=75934 RepID=A0ABD0YA30_UMBPY